jgi:hypothetical protein
MTTDISSTTSYENHFSRLEPTESAQPTIKLPGMIHRCQP